MQQEQQAPGPEVTKCRRIMRNYRAGAIEYAEAVVQSFHVMTYALYCEYRVDWDACFAELPPDVLASIVRGIRDATLPPVGVGGAPPVDADRWREAAAVVAAEIFRHLGAT